MRSPTSKDLISSGHVHALGACDGSTARLTEQAGFRALCASGFAASAALGLPDAELYTRTESLQTVRTIRESSKLPVAEIDTGYGIAVNATCTAAPAPNSMSPRPHRRWTSRPSGKALSSRNTPQVRISIYRAADSATVVHTVRPWSPFAGGIAAIVAESLSPGIRRGETFNGLPLITIPGIATAVQVDDAVTPDRRTATPRRPEGTDLVGIPPNPRTIQVTEAGGSYELLLTEHAREGQIQ